MASMENQDIQQGNEIVSISVSKLQIANLELKLNEVNNELSVKVLDLAKSIQLREDQEKQHLEEKKNLSIQLETVNAALVEAKKQFEAAQLTIENLSTSNKIIEDQLRFSKDEVTNLRMKKEDDFRRTKIALLETQQKLLEIQRTYDQQRDEISVCKNVIDDVLQNQTLAVKAPTLSTQPPSQSPRTSQKSKSAVLDLIVALEDEVKKLLEEIADLKHRADIDSINAKSALLESNNQIRELVVANKVQEDRLNSAMEQIISLKEQLTKKEGDAEQSKKDVRKTAEAATVVLNKSTNPEATVVQSPNQLGGESTGSETESGVKKPPKIGMTSFAVVVFLFQFM